MRAPVVLVVMVILLPVAYVRERTTMKPQSVKERSKIAEGRERAPRGTDAQRRAGHPVKHPDRNDRSRAIWHLADRHQLAATVLGVENGHTLPDERVPGVVNLASVTDTGRMKRSL
jgi:hypothetical protein